MTTYNLTDEQKELLRRLVKYVREGKLKEPIIPIEYPSDKAYGGFIGAIEVGEKKPIELRSLDNLDALCEAGLMGFKWNTQGNSKLYSIKKAAYSFVDSDFEMLSTDKPGGDPISVSVGESAQNVAVGKNIQQQSGGSQTRFHGPVTGPIHTGSGDININTASSDAVVDSRLDEPVVVGVARDKEVVVVVNPGTSVIVDEIPKQEAYERIVGAASKTRQELTQIFEQGRQQAADWTRYSIVAAVLGFLIVLGGVVALLFDMTAVGLVSVAASIIPEVAAALFYRRAREANRRVDETQEKLFEAEGIYRAIDLAMTIDDEEARDRLKETIILQSLGLSGAGEVDTKPPSEFEE